jgi:type IV secretory pathway protease TraF
MKPYRIAIVAVVIVVAAVCSLAWPARYVVDGVSMGPGVLPGDVISTGWFSRWPGRSEPQRFEKWIVTLPDGSTGLKRVIGLPGETVSMVDGDLAIDGVRLLKNPRQLAATGSSVAITGTLTSTEWSAPASEVLDDAPFATGEVSRLLLPVHDGGFAAEVSVPTGAIAGGPLRVRAEAGPFRCTWRIKAAGRYAVVVGRLDGHGVAACWPLRRATTRAENCLPVGVIETWSAARPWPAASDAEAADDTRRPALGLVIDAPCCGTATIDRVVTWRDILYRPAADGVTRWALDAGATFVLGDFPPGSRDSRHFGPLPAAALRHPIR